MMEERHTFLSYVAKDLLEKYGQELWRVCVVFPNKRASLFLDNELSDLSGRPLWSPHYTTISELFCSQSARVVADPIKSVCDLHQCYEECTGMKESLDQFYGWGQVMLSDFEEVDKNLAAPGQVFANVSDLHSFDTVDYLNDTQREALKRFFGTFSDSHDDKLKERFLLLWNNLGTIYTRFNERLAGQGLGYEGSICREVASREAIALPYDYYLFIGFHALSGVEKKLFKMVKAAGKARFYWDYDHYYMGKEMNESDPGYFIKQQLVLFPNELEDAPQIYDHFSKDKTITYVSAPSQDIQARYVGSWLNVENRLDGLSTAPSVRPDTAIVLCDESLLPSVIHSLPASVGSVNITSGLPLRQSPVYSFLMRLMELQTIGHPGGTDKYRLTYVKGVLLHPLATTLSAQAPQLLQELQNGRRYFPRRQELQGDEHLRILFADIDSQEGASTYSPSRAMVFYLTTVVRELGQAIGSNAAKEADPFLQETVYRSYTILNRLAGLMDSGDLRIDLITLERLFTAIVDTTTIPFHGEPAVGVQVMGVLETRNLDFKHLLLLSCNEKNMPKVSATTSLIPYAVRQAYGLTTPDHQSSIYAYYFYHILQRCEDATLVYCNVPDNRHSGEMSRYMLQMLINSRHTILRRSLSTEIKPIIFRPGDIAKDEAVMTRLHERFNTEQFHELSPTAVNRYLRCPLIFYYNYVAGLKEPDDFTEDIDNMMFGTLFHKAAENVYTQMHGGRQVTKDDPYHADKADVENVLKQCEVIDRCVDDAFREDYFNMKPQDQRQPEYNGLQLLNRQVIVRYLTQLMNIDAELAPFTILGLECPVYDEITLSDGHRLKYGGVIDRLDTVKDATTGQSYIRVLDYKTGSNEQKDLPDVGAVFDPVNIEKHSDYYLQTLLYSLIVSGKYNPEHLDVRPALLFIQKAKKDYDPVLTLNKTKIANVETLREEYSERLRTLLEEIFSPDVPFAKTTQEKHCERCPYRKLCY